jgi:hypothetical protein
MQGEQGARARPDRHADASLIEVVTRGAMRTAFTVQPYALALINGLMGQALLSGLGDR